MAKRFCDTDRWKKGLLRGLKGAYKLLWLYLNDDCSHAGIWIVDWEVAMVRIGMDIPIERAREALKDHIVDLGDEWFLRPFIEEQYNGELNPDNKVHASIIKILRQKKIPYEHFFSEENKGLGSPLLGAMDKETGKGSGEGKGQEELDSKKSERARGKKMLFPLSSIGELKDFLAEFANTTFEAYDLKHYHEMISNWADSNEEKRIDWVAFSRKWILKDIADGKAKLKNDGQSIKQPQRSQISGTSNGAGVIPADRDYTNVKL